MRDTIVIASSASPDRGSGISTYSKEISANFANRGYRVLYVCPPAKDKTWLIENGIDLFESDPLKDQVEVAKSLLTYIQKLDPVGVINNDNSVLQSLFPIIDVPAIAVGHLDTYAIAALVIKNKEWCDYIVAISNDMKDNLVNRHGVDLAKCPVIHNGLEAPKDIKISDRTKGPLRVICATEFSRRKGGDHVLKLVKMIEKSSLDIELSWYGEVPEKIHNQIKSGKKVMFKGRVPRPQLLADMRKSDVFLMASRMEGCPMSMLEAMSYGVIPIVSDGIGAMKWLINSGMEGFICSLSDWAEQALNCLNELAGNRKRLVSMRQRTRARFLRESTVDRVVTDLLGLIENPTIDRTNSTLRSTQVFDWHRNKLGRLKGTLSEGIRWRFGLIKEVGKIEKD